MLLKDNVNCFEGTSFIFRKLGCQKTYLEIQSRVRILACMCAYTHIYNALISGNVAEANCDALLNTCITERVKKKSNGWRLSPSPSREQACLHEGLSGKTLNLFTAVAGTLTRPLLWTWLWDQRMPCLVWVNLRGNWEAELPQGGWKQVSLCHPSGITGDKAHCHIPLKLR